MAVENARNLALAVSLGLAVRDDAATDQRPDERVDIEHLELEGVPVIEAARIVRVRAVRSEAAMLRPGDADLAALLDDEIENLVDVRLRDVVVFDDHRLTTGVATLSSMTVLLVSWSMKSRKIAFIGIA